MICTVQYMDLTPPVNIDELQQVEYDMYCTIHGSLLHLLTLKNYIKWSMICTVQYMDLNLPDNIDDYNKWSMIYTAQYMDLTLPVSIDELQQVKYHMYCTIHGSYSTC